MQTTSASRRDVTGASSRTSAARLACLLALSGALAGTLSACGGDGSSAPSMSNTGGTGSNGSGNSGTGGDSGSNGNGSGTTSPATNHTLLIDLDGATYAAVQSGIAAGTLPNLAKLQIQLAYSGGVVGTTSQQPNLDTPGWASLLTGAWALRHQVTSDAPNQALHSASVFEMTKAVSAGLNGAAVASNGLAQLLAPQHGAGSLDTLTDCSLQNGDDCVTQNVVQMIDGGYTTVVAQYHSAENAALNYGLSSSNYTNTLVQLDKAVGTLVAETAKHPNWLIAVTASHGLNEAGGNDGLPRLPESTTFVGLNQNSNVTPPSVPVVPAVISDLYAYSSIADVTPTLLSYMSALPSAGNYAMDGASLLGGLPAMQLTGTAGTNGTSVALTWQAPAGQVITVLRDGQAIATLPAGTTSYTDKQLNLTTAGNYQLNYTLQVGTALRSTLVPVAYVPPVPLATTLKNGLVTYYPFGALPPVDTLGQSTMGPWASDVTSGSLTPDLFGGQGLLIDTSHADQNGFDGYKLTQNVDVTTQPQFTIGFWFKTPGITTGDVAVFSNKDYTSGGHAGVAIGLFPTGIAFNVGDGSNRADGPLYTPFSANQWVYLALSVDTVAKTMNAYVFDPAYGEEKNLGISISAVNLTKLPGLGVFGVGEDGTGKYVFNKCADKVPYTAGTCLASSKTPIYQQSFSDLALWNRVVSEAELQSIAASKLPLSTLTTP